MEQFNELKQVGLRGQYSGMNPRGREGGKESRRRKSPKRIISYHNKTRENNYSSSSILARINLNDLRNRLMHHDNWYSSLSGRSKLECRTTAKSKSRSKTQTQTKYKGLVHSPLSLFHPPPSRSQQKGSWPHRVIIVGM